MMSSLTSSGDTPPALAELLSFYRDAGVNTPMLDAPVNRFEEFERQQAKKSAPVATPTPPSPVNDRPNSNAQRADGPPAMAAAPMANSVIPNDAAIESAKALTKSVSTLEELKKGIEAFEGCNLRFSARTTVFADGDPASPLMLIGEAPGRDEDAQGVPFVGRSGQLLNKMLGAIGLERESVYITNSIPWRPPGNRAPSPAETEICRPFLERHIELAAPQIIVLIGSSPAKTLLHTNSGIMNLRGKWTVMNVGGEDIPVLPTLHPEYLLRKPAHKRLAWADLQMLQEKLKDLK